LITGIDKLKMVHSHESWQERDFAENKPSMIKTMKQIKFVLFVFLLFATLSTLAQPGNGSSMNLSAITICNQVWMIHNLDVTTYRNGDSIPKVTDPKIWAKLLTGAYCYYNNDSAGYAATYGKLYNWYAVNDPRGLAPNGWHVPGDAEWAILENCLGGSAEAGNKMKEAGYAHWESPNAGATNSSGFTGLPGGCCNFYGSFHNLGVYGYWWSSTENRTIDAWYHILYYYAGLIGRNRDYRQNGFSVRCLKD
jgi:uncharacterized protein (TIGR02145 family)